MLLLVPAIVVLIVATKPENEQPLKRIAPAQIEAVNIVQQDLDPTLRISGRLQSQRAVTLRAEVSGKIIQRDIESGSYVEHDAVLLTIDSADLRDSKSQTEARIEQERATISRDKSLLSLAKENLNLQQREVERLEKLGLNALSSESQLGNARQQLLQLKSEVARLQFSVDSANSRIKQLGAELSQVERKLERATVRAPFAGVVNQIHVDIGDYAAINQNLIEIVSTALEMRSTISASMDDELVLGGEIKINVGEKTAIGHVRSFQLEPDPKTNTRQVVLAIDDETFQPGAIAEAEIPLKASSDVMVIPVTAVLYDGGKQYLFEIIDNVLHKRQIVLGGRSGSLQVVKSGVQPGITVVARDVAALSDQQQIVISNRRHDER